MSALKDMIALDEKLNSHPTLKNIDIDDIEVNENNIARICDITELAESIRLYGLMKPLEVFETEEGTFRLLGGERRYTAIKKLINSGEDINPDVPCLIYRQPKKKSLEKLQIILSNAQRVETEDDRISVVKMLLEILDDDKDLHVEGRKRDWIAQFIGRSPRTVQKYINIASGKNKTQSKESTKKSLNSSSLNVSYVAMKDEQKKEIEKIFSSVFTVDTKIKLKKENISIMLSFSDLESLENAVLLLKNMKGEK